MVETGEPLAMIDSKLVDQRIIVEGELAETLQELQNLSVADSLEKSQRRENHVRKHKPQPKSNGSNQKPKRCYADAVDRSTTSRLELMLSRRSRASHAPDVATSIRRKTRQSWRSAHGDRSHWTANGKWNCTFPITCRIYPLRRSIQNFDFECHRFGIGLRGHYSVNLIFARTNRHPNPNPGTDQCPVDLDESRLEAGLAARFRVIAKIECGKKTTWFLLTYELAKQTSRLVTFLF